MYNTDVWEESLKMNMYTPIVSKYPQSIEDIFVDWVVLAEVVDPIDVHYWVRKGIDLNKEYPNLNGSSPLEIACIRLELGMIKGFIEYGAVITESCKEVCEKFKNN